MPLTIRFVTRYSHVTARGGLMCDETIEKACVWTGGVRDAQSRVCVHDRVAVIIVLFNDGAHRAVLDTNLCLHVVRRSGPASAQHTTTVTPTSHQEQCGGSL